AAWGSRCVSAVTWCTLLRAAPGPPRRRARPRGHSRARAGWLTPELAGALARSPAAAKSPATLHRLPAAQIVHVVDAYARTIDYVFRWVVPVALVGFVVAWFLKEVPLRDSARAGASDLGEGFAAPDSVDSDQQFARTVARVLRTPAAREAPAQVLLASGSHLTRGQAWMLGQIHFRE